MKLCDELTSYVHAAFSGIWVQSLEPDEAEREIVRHARTKKWKVAVWDIAHGLRLPGNANSAGQDTGAGDPLAALRALPALAETNGTALLLLHNGASEANVRQALRIADAMSPCILFCDELDKGLSGVGGQGDSGVSTRLFGTLLTWLAETDILPVRSSLGGGRRLGLHLSPFPPRGSS